MIGFFRSIFQSKIGLFFTFAFVGLIAVAFASADITGSTFGGVTGNDVAIVGDESIGSGELTQVANNVQRQVQQQNPQMDMKTWVDDGGLDRIMDQLIDQYALVAFGKEYGMVASKRLVDSQIIESGNFDGPTGDFSEETFRDALNRAGITEAAYRRQEERTIIGEQIITPVFFGMRVPENLASPIASLQLEGRTGQILLIPSVAYVPKDEPNDKTLAAYYAANAKKYQRAEQRKIRYAVITTDGLGSAAIPTEAELQAAYKTRNKEFSANETRSFTQVILPTEAAAKALAKTVAGGTSLAKAASDSGYSTSRSSDVNKEEFTKEFSVAVADAVFAAQNGKVSTPARSGLGWHIARIENIRANPARSFSEVRGQLLTELGERKTLEALGDKLEVIEEKFIQGATLPEVAKSEELKIQTSPLLLATGQSLSQQGFEPSQTLQAMLQGAFAMEADNSEPQLVELEPGKRYGVYDVSEVKPAAPPPLAEMRARVLRDYMLEKGSAKAKATALNVKKGVQGGKNLNAAMSVVNVRTPPVENVGARRIELERSETPVPPPLALMFSMIEKDAKIIEAPDNQGWYVVYLDTITAGNAAKQEGMIEAYQQQLRPALIGELQQQFLGAVRKEVGVEREDTAYRNVSDRLTGRDQN